MEHAQNREGIDMARLWAVIKRNPALFIVLAVAVVFSFLDERFLSLRNIENIGNQASYLLILALAQTIVLLGRGFDLSMGNTVSLISVAIALVMTSQSGGDGAAASVTVQGVLVALLIGTGVGALIGAASGLLGANSFIISLGAMNICYGIAATISGGRPVFNVPAQFIETFNSGSILLVPVPIFVGALASVALHVLLSRTVYGRLLYLVGSNPRAVHVAGHDPRRIIALSFVIAGALVALSALLLTARTGTGEPNLGANLLLQAIASAVIGGVSLSGGKGTVLSALFGALTITVLSNILNLMGVSGYIQSIVLGAVIILALWLERSSKS